MAASSIAVRVSAGITILGSVLALAFGGVMLAAGFLNAPPESASPSPIPYKPLMLVMAAFFVALAGWGMSTGICILLRQRWARISILVFAAALAFVFGSGSVMTLFMSPPPTTPDVQALMPIVFRVIAGVDAVLAGIGIWWLVLFNRRSARDYFVAQDAPDEAGARPLSITIIAWFLLISAVSVALPLLLRFPAMVFGSFLKGWAAAAVYAAFLAVQVYSGVGLLRLRESGRIAAIVYFSFAAVNMIVCAARANFAELMAETQKAMPKLYPSGPPPATALPPMAAMMGISAVIFAIPMWFLIRRRSAFNSPGSGSAALPL